jgi:hypothetical protein
LHVLDHLSGGLAVIFVRDVKRTKRSQFVTGVANHSLKCLVSGSEMIALIHNRDAHCRCFEHAPPARLACPQRLLGRSPPQDFLLKIGGTLRDAPLQFRIGLTQRGFGALPTADLFAEKALSRLQLRPP